MVVTAETAGLFEEVKRRAAIATCACQYSKRPINVTFGEDGLLAFLGLALAHEMSNATKTVTAAREEMAKTVYRGKSANSAARIG